MGVCQHQWDDHILTRRYHPQHQPELRLDAFRIYTAWAHRQGRVFRGLCFWYSSVYFVVFSIWFSFSLKLVFPRYHFDGLMQDQQKRCNSIANTLWGYISIALSHQFILDHGVKNKNVIFTGHPLVAAISGRGGWHLGSGLHAVATDVWGWGWWLLSAAWLRYCRQIGEFVLYFYAHPPTPPPKKIIIIGPLEITRWGPWAPSQKVSTESPVKSMQSLNHMHISSELP